MRISGAGDKEPRCACIFSKFSAFDYGVCAVGKKCKTSLSQAVDSHWESAREEERGRKWYSVLCSLLCSLLCEVFLGAMTLGSVLQ